MILGFQPRFVPAVAAGTKPHSIRAGKRWRVGMSIQFYQNVRQKGMAKIRENGEAKVVQDILIKRARERYLGPPTYPTVHVDGRELTPLECQELARKDGFDDFKEMTDWFSKNAGLPFTGQLICWTDIRY